MIHELAQTIQRLKTSPKVGANLSARMDIETSIKYLPVQDYLLFYEILEGKNQVNDIDAWQFGAEADLLAKLVLEGTKTATASAYDLYAVDNDPLPEVGSYDVILDGQEQAVCIIKIIKVSIVPFKDVSAEHAWKEGEGDKSLDYWRDVHQKFFTQCFDECDLTFTTDSRIVLEEFQVVYPQN